MSVDSADMVALAGCACVLVGVYLFSGLATTLIIGGIGLTALGLMLARGK